MVQAHRLATIQPAKTIPDIHDVPSTPGVNFRAERNPHDWKSGFPHIDAYEAVVMPDLTRIFASFRAQQLTMTGIGRHLERPEADILQKDFPDAVVALGPRGGGMRS